MSQLECNRIKCPDKVIPYTDFVNLSIALRRAKIALNEMRIPFDDHDELMYTKIDEALLAMRMIVSKYSGTTISKK